MTSSPVDLVYEFELSIFIVKCSALALGIITNRPRLNATMFQTCHRTTLSCARFSLS